MNSSVSNASSSNASLRQQLGPAAAAVTTMLRRVDTADPDAPTPCPDWSLLELAQHAVGTTTGLAKIGRKAELGDDPWAGPQVSAEDWAAVLADRVSALADAWADDEAWSGTVQLGAEMPAESIGEMAYAEILLHGWDVAATIGADLDVSPEQAAELRRTIEETAELGRQLGAYGPAVAVADDASDLDRALGAAGRDPQWRPGG